MQKTFKTAREAGISNKMLREWKCKENIYLSSTFKKTTTRIGSGRTAFSPELEIQLNKWLINDRRVNKRIISYNTLREKALEIINNLNLDLKASNS